MWHTYNTWGDDVSCIIFRMKGPKSRSHGWLDFFYSVCSVVPSLFHWFTSFELHTQLTREQYVNMHLCQVKRLNVKVTRSFAIFAVSPPYFPPYLSEWVYDVLHPISVTKDDRSRSNASFQVWPFFLPGFIPIWPNHFICGIHTTHEEVMCPIPFPGSKVKGQGHMGRIKFWPCPLCGSSLFDFISDIQTTDQGDDVLCTIFRMKGQGHIWVKVYLVHCMASSLLLGVDICHLRHAAAIRSLDLLVVSWPHFKQWLLIHTPYYVIKG